MTHKANIPKELHEPFDRVLRLIPSPYRSDARVRQTLLVYLELKGEKFVRDGISRTLDVFMKSNRQTSPNRRA